MAKFIRAWNWSSAPKGWAIVDSMMNIPILEWAAKDSSEPDPRFSHVARLHADTIMRAFIRPDGSVNHIVDFDTNIKCSVYSFSFGFFNNSAIFHKRNNNFCCKL